MRAAQIDGRERDLLEIQALSYFNRNPDEELTIQDAMTKFDCSQSRASQVLNGLVDRGALGYETRRQGMRQVIKVYRRAE